MRQMIAIGFSLNAFYYASNQRLKPYIIMLIVGTLFHVSCLVSLIYLLFFSNRFYQPLGNIKFIARSKREYFLLFNITPLVLFGLLLVITIFIVPKLFALVVGLIFPKYAGYLASSYMGASAGLHTFLVSLAILIAYYFLSADESRTKRIYIFVMMLGVLFNSLAFGFALMTRIAIYYQIVEIVCLPSLMYNNRLKGVAKPIFKIIVFISCIAYFVSLLCFSAADGARDYMFA